MCLDSLSVSTEHLESPRNLLSPHHTGMVGHPYFRLYVSFPSAVKQHCPQGGSDLKQYDFVNESVIWGSEATEPCMEQSADSRIERSTNHKAIYRHPVYLTRETLQGV